MLHIVNKKCDDPIWNHRYNSWFYFNTLLILM